MEALKKLQEFKRFGSRLGLERMSVLMEMLGNPQDELSYIHIAGTNGKGSVSRYIYEGLRANDYKVGLYTSPFLEVFNERMEFDGEFITDLELDTISKEVLEAVDKMLAMGYESPTEFEVTTAIAFLYFKQKNADFVVLEVGLGGIGDSTNIIKNPLACVITSISFDHMDRLGNTLSEIAKEKAGIIKQGVPVIMNVSEREAKVEIARKAYEKECVLYDLAKLKYGITQQSLYSTRFDTEIYGTDYSEVEITMVGDYQITNAMTALATIEILRKERKIKVERSKLYEGIKRAKQIGRFEIMQGLKGQEAYFDNETQIDHATQGIRTQNPNDALIILDGAHNEDGARALRETVQKHFEGEKILMVCGMLADKNYDSITDNFSQIATDFVVTEPNNERKLDMNRLKEILEQKGKNCIFAGSPSEACEFIKGKLNEYDAVIFAGSLYLIGEIRGIVKKWNH